MAIDKLIFNVTYQVITPESAECGDFEDTGFELENYQADDIGDIISLIYRYDCYDWSNSDGTGWLYGVDGDIDYTDGSETRYAIHAVNGRAQRYLEKAFKLVR